MADEAVVRIIMEDGGQGTSGRSSSATPPSQPPGGGGGTPPPQPPEPPEPPDDDRYLHAEAMAWLQAHNRIEAADQKRISMQFEAATRAVKAAQREEERLDELFFKQLAAANRALEIQQQEEKRQQDLYTMRMASAEVALRAERVLEDRGQRLLELEAQAALLVARKQQAAAEEAANAGVMDAEIFDPVLEAQIRRGKELQKQQVESEYQRMYGRQSTPLDSILKIADSLRGTIGGVGGPLIGGILDFVTALRRPNQPAGALPGTAPGRPATAIGGGGGGIPPGGDVPTAQLSGGGILAPWRGVPDAIPVPPQPPPPPAGGVGGFLGGMGESLAAAVPVVGAVLAGYKILQEVNKAVIGGIRTTANAVTGAGTMIASADPSPSTAIDRFGSHLSNLGEKVATIVPLAGYLAVGFGEAGKSLAALMKEIDRTTERYGEYSAVIAGAQAIAEITQTVGDLRRAQQVAPELAKFVQAQSELQQRMEDIKAALLVRILPPITAIMERIEGNLEAMENIGEGINSIAVWISKIPESIGILDQNMKDAARPEVKDPTEELRFNPGFEPQGDFVPNR